MSNAPGPVRARRGELLGSRRQPPRRQRADAGACRRLLRHPVHARPLPRPARRCRRSTTDHDAFGEAAAAVTGAHRPPAGGEGHSARSATSIARLGAVLWDKVGHVAHRRRASTGDRPRFRTLREEFWQDVSVPGDKTYLNQALDYAGPRRRLPGVRRAAGARCAASHANRAAGTSAKKARRPDGEALRDDEHFSYVAAWEFSGVGQRADAAPGAAGVRERAAVAAELQVGQASGQCRVPHELKLGLTCRRRRWLRCHLKLRVWRQAGPDRPGRLVDYTRRRRLARHVLPRDARRRQRRADPQGRRADRVRLGLPRGHLRHLRRDGQRRGARPRPRRHRVPAAHAPLQRRRDDHRRAVARQGFPIVKDLVVDRSAFDRIIAAGGYVSVNTGARARGQHHPGRRRRSAEQAMDSAQCIGCGACVAACKNASAALFTSAKITHLGAAAAGPSRTRPPRRADGRADGRRRLRHVLERGRVRGGLPEGDLDLQHRADEPRILQGSRA